MTHWSLFAILAAVLFVSGPGCVVTKSSYDLKAQETDSLRSALASLNREKAKLAEENAALSAQVKDMDESLKRLGEGLPESRRTYDKERITRGQFVDELLEGERATGRRMQELSTKADKCENELARVRVDASSREREVEELENRLSILTGRVERIREEDRDASLRRNETLTRVETDLEEMFPEIGVTPIGSSLRIVVPEKLLFGDRGGKLTKAGAAIVSRISEVVSELPSASLLIITDGKASAETLRAAASSNGKVPRERLQSRVREKGRGAEFLLVVR